MKIQSIQVLKGPNIWSVRREKLIQMRLDLEDLEYKPSNEISGFKSRLEALIPSLYTHRCSKGHEGGFLERVEEGTWMGHIIEHIALEIQTLAGMDAGFGRTRSTKTTGVYNVVFIYQEESVGIYAAHASLRIAEALIAGEDYDLSTDINRMREMRDKESLGPSTRSIVDEAKLRDIPYIRLNSGSFIQLGFGKNQVRFRATLTDKTSSIAVDIAGDKEETKRILREQAIPVAEGTTISNEKQMAEAIRKIGFPLVFKPLNGNHGKGASINVKTEEEAAEALKHAQKYSLKVIVERFVKGFDFRILVINNKMVAAALRTPAHVKGDGKHTIAELIDLENEDPRRGYGHENVLTEIRVDRDTEEMLRKYGYTLQTIPAEKEVVFLKSTANLSTGGTSLDVTDMVHPHNIFVCERIARVVGLDICGIDIMAENLSQPLYETGGVVLEVNAAPGFRMHLAPSEGQPRNVAAPVIDMLYPPGKSARIPIIAITGTNGKTTTTRLIAHIIKNNGYRVGYTTSDGIYIQNSMMIEGDTTGPNSAAFVLKDPTVEFAVLETARGGILRSGLGFSRCDIAILTNIQEDHLGISDIHTLEDLTSVKKVVIESVKKDGWAILNADNPYCVKIGKETTHCNIAYFSMNEGNPVIEEHCSRGGVAAFIDGGYLTVKKGNWKIRMAKVTHVPITFNGTVSFMTQNAMAAALATFLWGFKIEDIRTSLETFVPSPAHTPGRMNIFDFRDYKILVDYAHNPDGLKGIKDFILQSDASYRTGVISGTGDRRDDDIREIGRITASMFDNIVICQEKYLRGRDYEQLVGLLREGIEEVKPGMPCKVIGNGKEAWNYIIEQVRPGELITIISDAINNAYETVKKHQDKVMANK
ncbi:cyanophycin synthetase [Pararcticibacter amylolyticus]|uniref:Cyanophycin synthetase n=1 Tax=Pararcticibacter amylolyticus TaxID=2173175 RepID=A0A2U2PMI9_9SPHI|nr:cyanophycin synthetase [Pararcticibacter amylolyticus]PWG82615.1 cyanophycin synthetase [Pararcticibacter amylolyticus]